MNFQKSIKKGVNGIDAVTAGIGKAASWLSLILVLWVSVDVVLRYAFDFSRVWMMEVETYLFSGLFLLAGAWAFQNDRHVRVDILYQSCSQKRQNWIDWVGTLVFLFPWTWIMMQVGWQLFYQSWKIGEHSSQSGGLGGLYVLKSLLFFAFVLLFLQAVSHWLRLSLKLFYGDKN
jgi:TRAP-type mannitol/chloroaromatic compound transport system permease small subunit